ncbi:MAG: hypothetical protein DRR19_06570 [Candidatus Parabeggiatoa sp. nov. 1]|nr:MAG: hypothetical protein DRR19_06570 [Gammaproteobacteria bacterium]
MFRSAKLLPEKRSPGWHLGLFTFSGKSFCAQKLLPENPFGVEIFKSSPSFAWGYLRKPGFHPYGVEFE